jgi:hypothetical protein
MIHGLEIPLPRAGYGVVGLIIFPRYIGTISPDTSTSIIPRVIFSDQQTVNIVTAATELTCVILSTAIAIVVIVGDGDLGGDDHKPSEDGCEFHVDTIDIVAKASAVDSLLLLRF